jgi:RNA polymerase sigma-70 factor (ECF subfamily)
MPGDGRKTSQGVRLESTTQWSLVLAAGDQLNPDSREALATLCQIYWYPVYAQVRHAGHRPDVAQDLTQGFFTDLLERNALKVARPERGRFRSFLRAALRHYLSHERDRVAAQKRGGGIPDLSLDFERAEDRFRLEPADEENPESLFEKRWARDLLSQALERLRIEADSSSDRGRYYRLETFLTGGAASRGYAQVASELNMTEGAVEAAVRRLRKRFGVLLRAEVARTVNESTDVNEELRYLLSLAQA